MLYELGKIVCSFILLIFYPFNVKGVQNIPKEGGAILVSNHQSNWDPIIISMLTYRRIHFLGKVELFKIPFLAWFFKTVCVIPIDRKKVKPRTLIDCMKLLKDGSLLGIFPEGTRVKKKAKPMDGFVLFSLRTQKPIIPIHISGTIKPWHKIDVVVGEPIELKGYGKKVSDEKVSEIADNIMDKIYSLN